ncbi:hypothetical protein AMJ44_05840 [candidate division WOR-1 bacterium DG_54_3]|uniref:Polysaccharide chain length determinant N-terminal domain-containing protein n=1 Tax=candidate division WOR-1 bacterium DG_54_3 TaxID=1703775 RepID=A0A0S7Y1M4_UNCSA|nr:MAG: hypothetical protein AMJ44_05840 [candidate division WOR-1 bacterium DG_54_3]
MSFSDYFDVIIKWRRFIVRNVVLICIAAAIISLLLTQKYTATATILPPNPNQEAMFGVMSTLMPSSAASSFSSLLSGMVTGVTTPSDLYATIMISSRIKREIIRKYNLEEEFKAKTMHDAFEALDEITKTSISPEGIISVSITYKDKNLATDIANSYVKELDKFNTQTTMTVGKRFRIFIEQRLKETTDSLTKAEDDLRNFQEKHKTIVLDAEIESAIQTIAELKSRIMLLDVRKGALSSSSQLDNPYLREINKELRELRKQLAQIEFGEKQRDTKEFGVGFSVPFSQLPEVSQEYVRLLREVKIQEAIFELLTQQYEQAKIMELKDTPTVQFLDMAYVPEKRSFPRRTLIVVLTFLISIFIHIPLVFLLEYINDIKTMPGRHTSTEKFISEISKDYKELTNFVKRNLRRSKD